MERSGVCGGGYHTVSSLKRAWQCWSAVKALSCAAVFMTLGTEQAVIFTHSPAQSSNVMLYHLSNIVHSTTKEINGYIMIRC